jgi:hypothetical protein
MLLIERAVGPRGPNDRANSNPPEIAIEERPLLND